MAPFPPLAELMDAFRASVRDSLGEAEFVAEHETGTAMSPEDALAWGVATGAAAVTIPGTASPDRLLVERLRSLVLQAPTPIL